MTRHPTRPGRPTRHFTLIEVMAVMVIISIMLIAVVPALDSLVPSYRLTSQARTVASFVELAQSEAVGRRVEILVAYNLDEETIWLILPKQAPPGEEGEKLSPLDSEKSKAPPLDDLEHGKAPPNPAATPKEGESTAPSDFGDRDALEPTKMPSDVDLHMVVVGGKERRSGIVYVPFTHQGNEGSHVVGLKLKQARAGEGETGEIWVKFNALTRTIEYHENKPQTRTISGAKPAGGESAEGPK